MGEDLPGRKRARMVMNDNWIYKDNKVIRQHRTPRKELYVPTGPMPVGSKDGKKLKFTDVRKTPVINNATGEIHEFQDNWRQVGPLALDYEWTGWTE